MPVDPLLSVTTLRRSPLTQVPGWLWFQRLRFLRLLTRPLSHRYRSMDRGDLGSRAAPALMTLGVHLLASQQMPTKYAHAPTSNAIAIQVIGHLPRRA